MAERPVFIPAPDAPGFVQEKSLTIIWAGGFAAVQKKKNVKALHHAAQAIGIWPILEASTKSDEKLGQHLSAFHLRVKTPEGDLPLECIYQGSKVFQEGGPYTDLYFAEPRSAKRDPRLRESGKLLAFLFDGHRFPLEPKTAFYDWLYITAIFPHRDWLDRLSRYAGFSDIEFNPHRSINCQARSLALFMSLKATHLLDEAVHSPEKFIEIIRGAKRSVADAAGEVAAVAGFSRAVLPEAVVTVEAKAERSQQTGIESATAVVPAILSNQERGATTQTLSNGVEETTETETATSQPQSDAEKPVPDFETFLRNRTLRGPKSPSLARRKRKARSQEASQQTTLPGHGHGGSTHG